MRFKFKKGCISINSGHRKSSTERLEDSGDDGDMNVETHEKSLNKVVA